MSHGDTLNMEGHIALHTSEPFEGPILLSPSVFVLAAVGSIFLTGMWWHLPFAVLWVTLCIFEWLISNPLWWNCSSVLCFLIELLVSIFHKSHLSDTQWLADGSSWSLGWLSAFTAGSLGEKTHLMIQYDEAQLPILLSWITCLVSSPECLPTPCAKSLLLGTFQKLHS